jgi:hypothetical protein
VSPSDSFLCLMPGVQFWEVDPGPSLGSISTLTVGARDLESLPRPLCVVLEPLGDMVRWHTVRDDKWANRIQRIKVARSMAEDLPGFSGTIMLEVEGVFTNASKLVPPLSVHHLEVSHVLGSTIFVIGPPSEIDPQRVCHMMAPWAGGVGSDSIAAWLSRNPRLFLLRIYSHPDHLSVAQLFGRSRLLAKCREELIRCEVEEIENYSEVGPWLRRGR